jgi:tetratricopeptide (TPR) repeat protein
MLPTKNNIQNLLISMLQRFRPTDRYLRKLSRKDRPGLQVELPNVPISLLEMGRGSFSKQEYAEALHFFSLAIKEDPNNAWGWHGRGDALQLLGDYKGSIEAYEKAILLQPNTALHYGGKSNALRGMGLGEKSDVIKKHALELDASIEWLFKD